MKTRRWIGVGAAGVLAVGLAACAPGGSTGSDDGGSDSAEGQTLTVWGWHQVPEWKAAVEAFSEVNPEITVEYRGYKADEYNTILQTGLTGRSGPDVMMLRSYGGLETVVAGGLVSPVGDDLPVLDGFEDSVIEGATARSDGEVYGVPFAVQTANVMYNKGLFAEHGLEVPTTWDEFVQACETLKDAGLTPLSSTIRDSWMLPIVRDVLAASAYGGSDFASRIESGDAAFTDDGYTEANRTLLEMKEYYPEDAEGMTNDDTRSLFVQEEAAMYPGGIWDLAWFRETNPDLDLGIFDVPPVDGEGEPYTMGYVDGSWGLSARASGGKRAAAVELLEWLAGEEYGQRIADDLLQPPAVPGVQPSDPLLAQALEGFASNPTPYLTYVHFDYGTPAGTGLEYDALQKMMLGEYTPEQVGEELDEGISQWLGSEG
jgi:raffinose/stachyose/melibiose transport system substrate-binding protein